MVDQGVDAKAIRAAVGLFHDRMLADPLLADAFAASDRAVLRAHQRAFVLQALGGPELYSRQDIRTAHEGLAITDAQFDRAHALLMASLNDVGVAPDVVERAAADIEPLRALIVAR